MVVGWGFGCDKTWDSETDRHKLVLCDQSGFEWQAIGSFIKMLKGFR
jgi:hypothetical protein